MPPFLRSTFAALSLIGTAAAACPDADRMGLPLGALRNSVCAPEHQMAAPLWIHQFDSGWPENWVSDVTEMDGGRLAVIGGKLDDQEPVGFLAVIDAAGALTDEADDNLLGFPTEVVWHDKQGIVVRDDRDRVVRLRDGERTTLEFASSGRRYTLAGMSVTPQGDVVVLGTEYGPFDPEATYWTFRPRDKRDAFGEEIDDFWQAHALIEADPKEDFTMVVASPENGPPRLVISDDRGKVADWQGWISEWESFDFALSDGERGAWIVTRARDGDRHHAEPGYSRVHWWRAGEAQPIRPDPAPERFRATAGLALAGDGLLLAGVLELRQDALSLDVPVIWGIDGKAQSRGWIGIAGPGEMRIDGMTATSDGRLILWGERFPDGDQARRSTGFVVAWDGATLTAPMLAR